MKVSVIIVNYNVRYFLEVCLHSVYRALDGISGEVIVVDNNSSDDSAALVRSKFPQTILIENKDNKGFSKANNQGVAVAKGEYILFLNPDTVMPEDFFQKFITYMDAHPEAGAIGPKLLDGKGRFAPDGKKSFPTLSVAIFKTTGLNKLFSKSPYFNKYYAVHIGEDETAPVEGLSGCCMMVRSSILPQIGGAFDEDFFMYCEDVDLCYRIHEAGYQNIYYPEAELIHYKGESTRKATLSYVRIFNEALAKFVKKHYSSSNARMFVFLINIGIIFRAILGVVRQVFKMLRMPLFDAIVLLSTLTFMKEYWIEKIKNVMPIPFSSVLATFPAYIILWIVSLYLNGAYDQQYRPSRVVRGMLIGTIIILAYYGLLQPEVRYSRAIIILTGFIGTVLLLTMHELLYRLGIFKFTPYDKLPRKAVIVAEPDGYIDTAANLKRVHYAPELAGRIAPHTEERHDALADALQMKDLLYTAGINEVIFCVNGLTYADIFRHMQACGESYEYKIHIRGSDSFVGSNSIHSSGDLYTFDRRFNLASFSQLRNKRILDVLLAILFIPLWPVLAFIVEQPLAFFSNIWSVLFARKTWVGYTHGQVNKQLPPIKPGILPPYNILKDYTPGHELQMHLNINYAQKYNPSMDFTLILKNLKYLGSN
jgi:GT2 family glycosyltransferase